MGKDHRSIMGAETEMSDHLLQVHAVDEVIGFLCGQGAGFLCPVADESEAAADHEQQQSGDEEAERQRKDGTCNREVHSVGGEGV